MTSSPRSTFAALSLWLAIAAAAAAQNLQPEVDRLVAAARLDGADTGIVVMDAADGFVLATRRAHDAMIPASNLKLVTSAAALHELGPDFTFRTTIRLEGDRLIFQGSGDPALADPEVLKRGDPVMTGNDLLRALARATRNAGVASVKELVVDDRCFDHELVHPSWNPDNLHLAYSAPVAGLNFHANVLTLSPLPSTPGKSPRFSLDPHAPWIKVDASRATTVAEGETRVAFVRTGAEETYQLRGEMRATGGIPASVTLQNPALFAGRLLAEALAEEGVQIADGARTPEGYHAGVRLAEAAEALGEGRTLAVVATAIDEVLLRCNTDSENLYAEALLKACGARASGRPGSWSNGVACVRGYLARAVGEQHLAGLRIADGSGLSRDNTLTPMLLARVLESAAKESWGERYIASLAAPGVGTLEKRFRNTTLACSVRAKSGYINGVRALSGYVTDPASGRRLVFVVIINNLSFDGDAHAAAKGLQEKIVLLLDRTLTQQATPIEQRGGGR